MIASTTGRSLIVLMAVILAIAPTSVFARLPPTLATKSTTWPIEERFAAPGPWTVVSAAAGGCCSHSGSRFDLWYPSPLGANGATYPIIGWGDGTNATPQRYSYLLSHLASWGFVVVASENANTADGSEILDAVHWTAAQNTQPISVFYHHLEPSRVGVMGHSQGATGALNAMARSNGGIAAAVPIELPSQIFCSSSINCADTRELAGGGIFLVNGSADTLISPSNQVLPWQIFGLQSDAGYYDATPNSVGKVRATLIGPNHNDVQGQPDCLAADPPCVNGVQRYLGYLTAWMLDRLQGDSYAREAFVAGGGELSFVRK